MVAGSPPLNHLAHPLRRHARSVAGPLALPKRRRRAAAHRRYPRTRCPAGHHRCRRRSHPDLGRPKNEPTCTTTRLLESRPSCSSTVMDVLLWCVSTTPGSLFFPAGSRNSEKMASLPLFVRCTKNLGSHWILPRSEER